MWQVMNLLDGKTNSKMQGYWNRAKETSCSEKSDCRRKEKFLARVHFETEVTSSD